MSRTQRECDSSNGFVIRSFRGYANDFAAAVQQWAAGIPWIESSVGLNPGFLARGRKLSGGADNPFGHREGHAFRRMSNGEDGCPLKDGIGLRKEQIGEGRFCEGG